MSTQQSLPATDSSNTTQNALASQHTGTFPQLLHALGASIAVSTYQAGKLFFLRAEGAILNTHFCAFNRPMGLAYGGRTNNRLIIGTANEIQEYRNVPALAGKLESPDKHDACFIPRTTHTTGNIDIHEMALVDNELWFVNTRFSCLCTLDHDYSFEPQWRPPFINAYAAEDRCHLNGLAVREGAIRYVSALGAGNESQGWRKHKADGGVILEVPSGKVIVNGIAMPHSPRWYRDQLWFLESGYGALCRVNPATGKSERIAQFPGFTRGLDFYGPFAFIGLSQVRETNIFAGIPITEDGSARQSGVWVYNFERGETIAFVKFSSAVQEVFAVQVLPNLRYPELLPYDHALLSTTYILPDAALA